MTHPDQDIIDFLTKDLDLRAAPDWMIERARAFRDGGWLPIEVAPKEGSFLAHNKVTGVFQTTKTTSPGGDEEYVMHLWGNMTGLWYPHPTHWRPLPNPPKDTEQ